eukprot:CAMPEP_0206471532 /NCGR_PEP_ID=MMETSP0324_2-20121206/31625_1 /ASSEMBLY_ACC=CAM_ASM_000836 /TAXON_ID=2866 /ORGANISM="Crypthecodinium cohnii, Strain Seligo" /LENGTH=62 /DNA_ID=CAMNT_0053945887 /DNA_START=182 /DNA_END=370 /DNA_ORIENTATION=-
MKVRLFFFGVLGHLAIGHPRTHHGSWVVVVVADQRLKTWMEDASRLPVHAVTAAAAPPAARH